MDTQKLRRMARDFVEDAGEAMGLDLSAEKDREISARIVQLFIGDGATSNTASPAPHELPESHPCYAPLTEPAPPPDPEEGEDEHGEPSPA